MRGARYGEYYGCHTRIMLGSDQCTQPTLPRAAVDDAVFEYFASAGLDLEATRAERAAVRDRRLAEAKMVTEQAEGEVRRAEDRLARVRRDYQEGKLDVDDWGEQREQLTGELVAAQAEVERPRASVAAVEASAPIRDAEQEVLEQLAEIRRAVKGEARDAEGIDAVRNALRQPSVAFVVHRRRTHAWVDRSATTRRPSPRSRRWSTWPEHLIELQVRPQAVETYDEKLATVLRREPL